MITPEGYQLLTAIVGGLIPALLTTIKMIVTLRTKRAKLEPVREQRGAIECVTTTKSKTAIPLPRKGLFRKFRVVILISVSCVIGFYIGTMTKKSLPVVKKLYNKEAQVVIAKEKIMEINRRIDTNEQKKRSESIEPTQPESERKAIIERYDKKIRVLTMEKAEFEKIARKAKDDKR